MSNPEETPPTGGSLLDRLIVAGLAAGLTPPIARVLCGRPSWRYRQVRIILDNQRGMPL